MRMGPPYGIPIDEDTHNKFPEDVQNAWETFHAWWTDQDQPVSRASMPQDIAEALETMKSAEIPGFEPATGKDSCYVVGVEGSMLD